MDRSLDWLVSNLFSLNSPNFDKEILTFKILELTCFSFVKYSRFTEFGGPVPYRPVEDLAYAVARFIQNRGSLINYYMVKSYRDRLISLVDQWK